MEILNSFFFHKEKWKSTIVQNETLYNQKTGHMEKWYVQPYNVEVAMKELWTHM
jgi:hypothetical protein